MFDLNELSLPASFFEDPTISGGTDVMGIFNNLMPELEFLFNQEFIDS